jgi:hypothetical protein
MQHLRASGNQAATPGNDQVYKHTAMHIDNFAKHDL